MQTLGKHVCMTGVPAKPVGCRQLKPLTRAPSTAAYCRSAPTRWSRVATRVAADPSSLGADEDGCQLFADANGDLSRVMCCDFGFRTGSARLYQEQYGEVPGNIFQIAWDNFKGELQALRRSVRYDEYSQILEKRTDQGLLTKAASAVGGAVVRGLSALDKRLEGSGSLKALKPAEGPAELESPDEELKERCIEERRLLARLQLSNPAVVAMEHAREKECGKVEAPWFIKAPFWALCFVLDVVYDGRPIQRFWVLETVARIPYFAYISILHLYESLGFWRAAAELRKIHFAEEWNELHHLQIMESLGGDALWFDRFCAQHAAILYYWALVLCYALSPRLAYLFSELVEWHAADTYAQFAESNKEVLRELPPPRIAMEYYKGQDLYMFDSFTTTGSGGTPRRPPCDNLYDVFINIRDDELEHVVTMTACQSPAKIAGDIQAKRWPASPEAGADKKEAGLTTGPAGGAYVPRAYLSSKEKKK